MDDAGSSPATASMHAAARQKLVKMARNAGLSIDDTYSNDSIKCDDTYYHKGRSGVIVTFYCTYVLVSYPVIGKARRALGNFGKLQGALTFKYQDPKLFDKCIAMLKDGYYE